MSPNEPLVRIVEIDTMTGWERDLPDYGSPETNGLWTREAAQVSVAWRRENITGRYDYRIEEVTPVG